MTLLVVRFAAAVGQRMGQGQRPEGNAGQCGSGKRAGSFPSGLALHLRCQLIVDCRDQHHR